MDDLELQPSGGKHEEEYTKVDSGQERKIMQRVYAAPDPNEKQALLTPATSFLLSVVLLGAIGYGCYFAYVKFLKTPEQVSQPVGIAAPTTSTDVKTGDGVPSVTTALLNQEAQKAENELKTLQNSLVPLQKQSETLASDLETLRAKVQELTKNDKKIDSKAASVMTFVTSAHEKLLKADGFLAGSIANLKILEEQQRTSTAGERRAQTILASKIKQMDVEIARSQRNVSDAEKYLLEKLNAYEVLLGTKRHWINDDLWDLSSDNRGHRRKLTTRTALANTIDQYSRDTKTRKDSLPPEVQSLQQQITTKQKQLDDVDGKIQTLQDRLETLQPQQDATEAAPPPKPPEE